MVHKNGLEITAEVRYVAAGFKETRADFDGKTIQTF